MRSPRSLAAFGLLFLATIALHPSAQSGPPAPSGAPAQGGGRRGGGPATFPAEQRPPGDPALIARGDGLYGVHCRACHGADLRGGDQGGPNLLRSQIVLNDQAGELIAPIVQNGQQGAGVMPPIPLMPDDICAIAEYIHSVAATMRGQRNPPAWRHPFHGGGGGGLLTTAGRVIFSGDGSGNFAAFDATDGKPLWHSRIGNILNAPQTYLVDGRQHVLVAVGDTLYAFAMY